MSDQSHTTAVEPWKVFLWGMVVLLATLVLGRSLMQGCAAERAVASLPADERAHVFSSSYGTLKAVCAGAPEGNLRGYCEEQARLVAALPECDAACHQLTERILVRPARPR